MSSGDLEEEEHPAGPQGPAYEGVVSMMLIWKKINKETLKIFISVIPSID
jgi:hypothetical protein